MNIDTIWRNIQLHEGETFYLKKGDPFTYVVHGDYLTSDNAKGVRVTKESLEKALVIENPTPSKINNHGIWAPSYIYGIITDERIRNA